ncbi:hypothetical protein BTO18_11765 [Polaribacter porphyrae]|uniref:Uncharacterized protein n=2 Tax=Polaribacter porphyrae TaxID=1137780 RepID=A0A2S7WQD2_9FLAO|nr:hypothetical protein BTO18_11765 [Polaribacter porphyrae]
MAVISGNSQILEGDSATVSVRFDGTAPFGLSYYWVGKNKIKYTRYIYDINNNNHDFKIAPDTTTTVFAEFTSTRFGDLGDANGQAQITVNPVQYIFNQTLESTNSAFIHATNGLSSSQDLDLRTQGGQFDRIVFIEFDLNTINTLEDKNRYILHFWLTRSHPQGASAGPGTIEAKALNGDLNTSWTWSSQPTDTSLELIGTKNFNTTTTSQQIKFEYDISAFVNKSLAQGENKIVVRIKEISSKGLYYIGSHTFSDVTKRPGIDVQLRRGI